MGGGSNGCIGCDEPFSEGIYDSVMFNIMRIRHSSDNHGPQRVREKDSVVRIHRKCLAEHVWKVRQYAGSCELADIEVQQWFHGQNLTQQLILVGDNNWDLRMYKEGGFMKDYRGFVFNKDVDNLLKRMIEKQDLCFVMFFKDNNYSPPVVYSMDDPLIVSQTSSPEYKQTIEKAVEEYKKKCIEIKKISGKEKENILIAGAMCVFQFRILLSLDGDTIESNPNETDVDVPEEHTVAPTGTDDDPIKILKMRYAKGEISREEFEVMKKDLE